jgi:hypothetical protein
MPINGKRVSAAEAAEILGLPRYAISRIDRRGEIIKRYKLGHKTHVYDLDSLHAYLEATLVRPIAKPTAPNRSATVRSRANTFDFDKREFSLKSFLGKPDAKRKK